MDCNSCKEKHVEPVPYIVHESSMARNERTIKRLAIALVIAILVIFASNALWLYEWSQYDYYGENTAVEAEDGTANYIGNDGRIIFGPYGDE